MTPLSKGFYCLDVSLKLNPRKYQGIHVSSGMFSHV
jgi:hypothetical protein